MRDTYDDCVSRVVWARLKVVSGRADLVVWLDVCEGYELVTLSS